MRDAILDKLEAELALPLRSERQAVYILVQIRKLLDRDDVPATDYPQLRFLCNWAVHTELSNSVVREKLLFLNTINPLAVSREILQQFQAIFSLLDCRTDLLKLIRTYRLNERLQHVFTPQWWVSFLSEFAKSAMDCPLLLRGKDIGVQNLEKLCFSGYGSIKSDEPEFEYIFQLHWTAHFLSGVSIMIPLALGIEKDTDFKFGREGRGNAPPTQPQP